MENNGSWMSQFKIPYHETKVSPTLSKTVNTATKILEISEEMLSSAKEFQIIIEQWIEIIPLHSTPQITAPTSIGTKTAVVQSQACSFPQF